MYLMREYRRYYPAGEVAGHILGFTSVDDEGQEGLELAFDHWLAGEDGAKRVIQDRYGKIVQNVEEIRAMRPGPQSRAVDRPAHPVPRVPRIEGRDPRPAREVGLGDRARRRDRRSARDGQPARLQPERPRPDQGQDVSQSRGHRHRRAGLVDQAVRRGRRARLGPLQRPQHHRHQPGLHQGRRQTTRGSAQPRRDQPRDHPRQELQRRHDQGGAGARARADVRHAGRARLRPGDHQRVSGRVGGPAASLLALAPGRHLLDVARLRPVDHAAAARACVRDRGVARRVAPDLVPARRDAARGRARRSIPASRAC